MTRLILLLALTAPLLCCGSVATHIQRAPQQLLQVDAESAKIPSTGCKLEEEPILRFEDVGCGVDDQNWVIGEEFENEFGGKIYKLEVNGVLTEVDGQAVRVDVDRYGNPWVVNAKGEVWHRVDNKWILVDKDANAIDIGVTVEGSVWAVRTNFNVAKLNPATGRFEDSFGFGGKGKAISVHPNGMPWVIGTDNKIWQLKLDNTWVSHDSCGIDIAIGKDGSVWSISCDANPEERYIMRLNRIIDEWMVSDIAARRICALNEITALFITPRGGLSRTVV